MISITSSRCESPYFNTINAGQCSSPWLSCVLGRARAQVLGSSGFPAYTADPQGVRESPFPSQVLSSFQETSRCLALSPSCGAEGYQLQDGPTFSHLWFPKRCLSSEVASGSSQPQEKRNGGLAFHQDTFHVTLREKVLFLTPGMVLHSWGSVEYGEGRD